MVFASCYYADAYQKILSSYAWNSKILETMDTRAVRNPAQTTKRRRNVTTSEIFLRKRLKLPETNTNRWQGKTLGSASVLTIICEKRAQ